MPEREQLLAIRRWLAVNHVSYRKTLSKVLAARLAPPFVQSDPQALQRTPKGFAANGPADDLLRATSWAVNLSLDVGAAFEPGFAAEVASRFAKAAPLVTALSAAMRGKSAGDQGT